MTVQRVMSISLALLLVVGICSNGAMSEACFCGEACLHSLQAKAEVRVSSSFHKRCPGSLCKSCNLENGQTLKAAYSSTRTRNDKIFYTTSIIIISCDYPSISHTINGVGSFHACGIVPSPPIYLQNLSLLC